MQIKRLTAVCAGCTAVCMLLSGCAGSIAGTESSGDGIWHGIESAEEGEFGKPQYADGIYLTQSVQEPVPDPYADDTKFVKNGTTDDGIRYALYERHAEIIGHTEDFAVEELIIPETLENLPVTRIADVQVSEESIFDIDKLGSFYGCYTLESVVIPEGVTDIGNYAFYGCKNMKKIEIPESVMHIGDRAYAMCSTLTSLTVPAGIDTIGDSAFSLTPWYDDVLYHRDLVIFNGRLYDAGRRCKGEITVPDFVVSVGDYAFYSCAELESVILPASVKSIGKYAFCDCPSLQSVTISNPDCEIVAETTTFSNKSDGSQKDFFKGTIYGAAGSTAEAFANQMKFKFAEAGAKAPAESSEEADTE